MADDEKKDDEDEKKAPPHWQWLLKHVVVPIATALIAAGAVQFQANQAAAEQKVKTTIQRAAQDAALKELLRKIVEDQTGEGSEPPPADGPPPPPFELPEEPPAPLGEYVNPDDMQQIEGNPVLLGDAQEQFRQEWQRVKAGIHPPELVNASGTASGRE